MEHQQGFEKEFLPEIKLSYFHHRGAQLIRIHFPYNLQTKQHLRKLSFVRWTKTHGCFYMSKDREQLSELIDHMHTISVKVDFKNLKESKSSQKKVKVKSSLKKANKKKRVTIREETLEKILQFQRYMEQRRYSRSTIKTYISMIKSFFAFINDKNWDEMITEDIEEYNYKVFISKSLSYSSQNQFISAIRRFYQFHRIDGLIPEYIIRPRKVKYLPNVLSKDEVKRIILATRNIKHKCLLSLIYGSGLRIGEALNLRLSDIRRKENLLYIRQGKGNKDRRVPLSSTILKLLEEYYYAYRPKVYVFEGQKGGKYSYRSSQQILQRAAKSAGINHRITLHTLRHSYATHLLESGVGLRYIQDILGHNSPKTTMLYTQVSGKKISEVRSPLEDLDI